MSEEEKEVHSLLCEGFHAAFRKGTDARGAHAVWDAIRDMDRRGYGEAISWLTYCLRESGYEIRSINPDNK